MQTVLTLNHAAIVIGAIACKGRLLKLLVSRERHLAAIGENEDVVLLLLLQLHLDGLAVIIGHSIHIAMLGDLDSDASLEFKERHIDGLAKCKRTSHNRNVTSGDIALQRVVNNIEMGVRHEPTHIAIVEIRALLLLGSDLELLHHILETVGTPCELQCRASIGHDGCCKRLIAAVHRHAQIIGSRGKYGGCERQRMRGQVGGTVAHQC